MVAQAPMRELVSALNREQLIDRILLLNPTACPAFLSTFTPNDLTHYLEHLHAAQEPRGRESRWIRRAETPAISKYEVAL